ncbi:hypothetical protein JCM3770_006480 [Rhodotorula araucariae]
MPTHSRGPSGSASAASSDWPRRDGSLPPLASAKRHKSVNSADGEDAARKKRKKTLRACDHCRLKRLRCDYIPDHETPLCYECEKRKLSCELVKPAQMDARKAVRLGLAAPKPPRGSSAAAAPAVPSTSSALPARTAFIESSATPGSTDGLDMLARWCVPSPYPSGVGPDFARIPGVDRVTERMKLETAETPDPGLFTTADTRILGETCVAQLLAELQPSEDLHAVDQEFGHRRAIDGSVTVTLPKAGALLPPDMRLTSETVLRLLQHFSDHLLPLWPVVTVEEIRSLETLSPVTLLSICVIAAASRQFPYSLFNTVRAYFKHAVDMSDVFKTSSIANMQALLIMTMSAEPHGPTASGGGSMSFLRTGIAARMAQDLGLHHAPPSHATPAERNTRMRLWLCSVISDRWYSATFGHPSLLDTESCHDYFSEPHEQDPFLVELYRLSELLQRALKAIDRLRIHKTTDEQLEAILREFDAWVAKLPPALQFAGPESTQQGGYLHCLLVAFESLFFRPFARPKSDLPTHLHFRPSPARWFAVVTRAQLAIDWVFQRGSELLDATMCMFYALMMATSVQFFAHTKSGQISCLQALETVKNGLHPWAVANEDGPFSTRQKVFKVSLLLYHAATKRHQCVAFDGEPGAGGPLHPQGLELPVPPAKLSQGHPSGGNVSTLPNPHPFALPHPPASALPSTSGSAVELAAPLAATSLPPLAPESALPDYLQTEWQGWCDSLLSTEDWDFLNNEAWAKLPELA